MHFRYKNYRSLFVLLALNRRIAADQTWSPIVVKNITELGRQSTPDVTAVSRDGGYSTLINGNIVWLYDDTECMDLEGRQHSFVSNTAAYAYQEDQNISTMKDFGVVEAGEDQDGRKVNAILADTAVGSGGWIPFRPDELRFNEEKKGTERLAICESPCVLRKENQAKRLTILLLSGPGTSPTPINTTDAFLLAPLIYVNPAKEFQARGMTLITIKAPSSGPIATRQGDLVIPGIEVAYGGFSAIVGITKPNGWIIPSSSKRDVYLLGTTGSGLQLARVGLKDIGAFDKYTFFNPERRRFAKTPPPLDLSDLKRVYLPGSFLSGNVFYSPYFGTFIMIYFNKMADSTFYIRHLNLEDPFDDDKVWARGGKHGKGINAEDAEALIKYAWSSEQKLYASPPSKGGGGFNYAGVAHPEYFNRQYFANSVYPQSASDKQRRNDWYGSDVMPEQDDKADGKHLLLSWTSPLQGGVYEIQLAMVEFDDIPPTTMTTMTGSGLPQGYRGDSDGLSSFLGPVTKSKKLGGWDLVCKAMVLLGIVAVGAFGL